MAGYVLFFPNATNGNDDTLRRAGLDHLLAEGGPEWANALGPDERRGMMAGWGFGAPNGPSLAHVERNWQQLPGKDIWLGTEVARPLAPQDIAWKKFHAGEWVTLGDRQQWYVPIAARLPHRGQLNADREFERVIAKEYEPFYQRSGEYYAKLVAALDQTLVRKAQGQPPVDYELTFEDGYSFAWQALSLNYRVTPEVLSVLGVMDDASLVRVISVAICQEDISDLAFKKKESLAVPVC